MRRDELTTVLTAINALTAHVDAQAAQMVAGFAAVNSGFAVVNAGFVAVNERIDRILNDIAGLKVDLALHRHDHNE